MTQPTLTTLDLSNPENWTYLGGVMLYETGSEWEAEMAEMIHEDMMCANNATTDHWYGYEQAIELATAGARFDVKGTCDHCGAHFKYGAIYQNSVTRDHAIIGHTCATNTLNLTASEKLRKRMVQTAKAIKSRILGDKREAALNTNRADQLKWDHYISKDLRSKFRQYGALSVKQWALVKNLVRQDIEKIYEKLAEQKDASPVVEGKGMTIEGEVLHTKMVEGYSYYSPSVKKMLVRDDRGFKVWGSVPAAIEDDVVKGVRVTLIANIETSKDDATFGFFKRPRKAQVLNSEDK